MNYPSLSTFRQDASSDYIWYGNGYDAHSIGAIPLGEYLFCLYSPAYTLKQWTMIKYQVKMVYDIASKKLMRQYVVIGQIEFEDSPMKGLAHDKV